ncbi:unnamed protein product, partial [Hapterophycus canaliculatus]
PTPGQRFQPQFAATAGMPQYAAYGGSLPAELHVADMYRNAPPPPPHHLPYRGAPMDLPRGSYLVPAPAPGYLAAPGPHGLGYYRQFTPGMMHMAAGATAGAGGDPAGGETLAAAMAAGGVGPCIPPEKAPPPSSSSGSGGAGGLTPTGEGVGGGQQPKESILESLLAARSERLSAASMEAEEASLPKGAENGGSSASPHASKSRQQDGGVHHPKTMSERSGSGADAPKKTGGSHEAQADKAGAGGGGGGAKRAHNVCAATATPGNVSAAVAMHLSGLPQGGGFPGMGGGIPHLGLHHGIGTMRAVGGLRGMPPPTAVTVPPAAGGPVAMQQYMASAAAAAAAAGQQQQTALGFPGSGHDSALEEQARQQEKKLQKRAANRKSAQLSRKRKKALIEELRYENQDLQRHEDILEVIPDPVFAFDTSNGRVWFASTSASAQFGLSVEDLTSACFFDLMTEDCSKRLKVLIDTAAKDVSETNSALLHE